MYASAAALRSKWSNAEERATIIQALEERGISFSELAEAAKQPDADPFDLLCHVAFNAPLRTRRERAEMLRKEKTDFFDRYSPEARAVLNEMLDKYIEYGTAQFKIPDILKVPPISERGTIPQIAALFGGAEKLRAAVNGTANPSLCSLIDDLWTERKPKTDIPQSTAQQLGSLIKSCRDIMRKDKGLNGDLDRLPMLTWIMFLKFLDDMEEIRKEEATLAGKKFQARHRTALPLARLGRKAGRHHRAGTHCLHQPG